MQHQKILILDFGSQVTQLIARRVREAHVYCEVHPCDVTDEWIREYAKDGQLKGVILSGSHASVYEVDDKAPAAVFELGIPVLGICYGMQTMANQLGGKVEGSNTREFGYAEVRAHGHTELLKGIEDFATPEGHGMLKVWMSHGDKVTELPPGFKVMCSTPSCPIAGMADESRHYYAVQFHPEVTHTVQGRALLERFVLGICGTRADWIMRDHIEEAVQKIREQVGDEEVILGLSGGVDSSVAAALIHRAIGDQLTCVFVDHGLLRLNEGDMVMDMFEGKLHAKVAVIDDEVSLVSTFNLDFISQQCNSEVASMIWSKDFAQETLQGIYRDHADHVNGAVEYTIKRDESGAPVRSDGLPVLGRDGQLLNDPEVVFGPEDHLDQAMLDKYKTKQRRWGWLRKHLPQLTPLETFKKA